MHHFFKVILILMITMLFTACNETQEINYFNESELKTLSESLVMEVVAGNVLAVYERIEATMQKDTKLEDLENHVLTQSFDAKKFIAIRETTITQRKDPLTKQIQAGVVVLTDCEKGTLQYSFIYNEFLEIIGFAVTYKAE